jgi:pimeloyl-ACP methyl ester carboxylesterase
MTTLNRFVAVWVLLLVIGAGNFLAAQDTASVTGKTPIIIVPGLTGSELVNSKTGEVVWYKTSRSKIDDVRLPISSNLARNRDDLEAGDIIRGIRIAKFLPEVEIYERLIDSLQKTGGYREAKWTTATRKDYEDTFYVFAYDWRRDNVENARLFIQKIEALKRRLGKPDLKFNVIAHSMGGLIARYAAMYGNADIPAGTPKPTWAGARHMGKIFMLGTPNEGSPLALQGLLDGVSYVAGGVNLPWVQNLSRFDVFTVPSVFQLLPHEGTLRIYDEDLKPMDIDIYNPAVWDEYDWGVWEDKDFEKKFNAVEQRNAKSYFIAVLNRAKRFQAALDANSSATIPVSFYLIGGDCKETLNAIILRRNEKKDRWITQFKADSYVTSSGQKISSEQLKAVIYTMGDSVVPKRSLEAATIRANGGVNALPVLSELYQCEGHGKLVTNPTIQQKLFSLLGAISGN